MLVQGKNNNRNQQFYLVCLHRGEGLFYKEIDRKKINSVLKIDAGQLRGGINRFVLLDNNLNPVSERLVFKEDLNLENIEISLNNESFSTREEVQLHLKSDNFIENELAQVSISVVDENYGNAAGIPQNIASYLLLDSELKGHIDSPAGYLNSDENLNAKTKLDLLMCTNGWRNYIWNSLKEDSVKIEFQPQLGLNFTGHVKRAFGNKALTEGNVSFLVKSDSTTQFLDTELDENGRFEFRNIVFYDSASVFAQARNKRDNHGFQFEMKMPEFVPQKINQNNLNQLNNFTEIPLSVYRQRYLNEMRLTNFYPEGGNILLEKVDIVAKPDWERIKYDDDFFGPGDKTAIVAKDDHISYSVLTLKQYLQAKGIIFRRYTGLPSKEKPNSKEPTILLDGTPTPLFKFDNPNFQVGHHLNMIQRIEVYDGVHASIFGFGGAFGVINIITKKGEELANVPGPALGAMVIKLNGFTPLREFYSPKYTPKNINSEAPDYRNTLYWNPKVNVVDGGQQLSFFTCDNLSRHKVFVEGISGTGRICLGSGEFEVNKIRTSIGE